MADGKKINSRQKGASFERQIATQLREWLGPAWKVSRSPTGWQKGQADDHGGEFTIVGPHRFPYAIECKCSNAFDEGQLWREPVPTPLTEWWAQAVRQAQAVDRLPLLVMRRNHGRTLAVLEPGSIGYASQVSMDIVVSGFTLYVVPFDHLRIGFEAYRPKKLPPPKRG